MAGGILILFITGILAFVWVDVLKKRYPIIDSRFLKWLFFYHLLLAMVYYSYALFNASDSRNYYFKVVRDYRGDEWFDFYGTSTPFVEFIAYPFIKYFYFSYEATMWLFSFFGYLGFVYLYIFFKENIRFKHTFLGFDFLTFVFLLPNLHFWSSSLGKGSIIFLGISLFFFGISKLNTRWIYILIGALIVYHVRPHVMLIIVISSAIGFIFSSKGVSWGLRFLVLACSVLAFFFIYRDVLSLVGIDEAEFLSEGVDLSHRATELSKATSGIDINNYSLPEKVFAFLYRPLFFDAPGFLGIIVSFENVFYLLITLRLFSVRGLGFVISGNFLVKSALLSFVTVSVALAQISGNLGLAIRQKSQVMMLFLFVILLFMDHVKYKEWKLREIRRQKILNRKRAVSSTAL